MVYDLTGSWVSTLGPNAPLNDTCSPSKTGSAVSALSAWTSAGFPASKLVLGVGSYGRAFNVTPTAALAAFGAAASVGTLSGQATGTGDTASGYLSGGSGADGQNLLGGFVSARLAGPNEDAWAASRRSLDSDSDGVSLALPDLASLDTRSEQSKGTSQPLPRDGTVTPFSSAAANATAAQQQAALCTSFKSAAPDLAGDNWDGWEGWDACGVPIPSGGIWNFWGLVNAGYLSVNGSALAGIQWVYDQCAKTVRHFRRIFREYARV
jgi:hypothetical protein